MSLRQMTMAEGVLTVLGQAGKAVLYALEKTGPCLLLT